MVDIVKAKFLQNPALAKKLKATDDAVLEEENGNRVGENRLGKILMETRLLLKK